MMLPPTIQGQEGSKGPLVARLAALRGIAVREGLPGPEVWLVRRRNSLTGALKTSLSHAPAATPRTTLVRLASPYDALHLGARPCGAPAAALEKKAPGLTGPQVSRFLTGPLRQRMFDPSWVLEVLTSRQQRHHAAYVSHRKRRLALLRQLE